MQVAIQTPPEHTDVAALRDLWQAADDLGFDAAFTFDHLVPLNPAPEGAAGMSGSQLEAWVTLAALAAGTRRLQVGTLVTGVTYRHPSMLTKMAVTLDHVTGGRAILGVGAAWHEAEHRMFGLAFPSPGERMQRLQETLELFTLLCQRDGPVSYAGRYYRLEDAVFLPKPVSSRGIPILVGGSGNRLRTIAARHAWIFNSFYAPWQWAEVNSDLDRRAREEGRDPSSITRSAFVFAELSRDPAREAELLAHFQRTRGGTERETRARVVLSDAQAAIKVLRSYHEAGITMVVLNLRPPFCVEGLRWFAEEVRPELPAS